MNQDSVLQVERGDITTLTINRPTSLNALNKEVLSALLETLQELAGESSLRGVILQGAGEKAFVAGADISSMTDMDAVSIASYVDLGQQVMVALEALPVPVIAAVDGFALGGGMELALACDLIYASARSRFGQPEVKLGIIPGFGGTQRLLLRTSIGTTRRLVYTGEMISAAEARALGIIDGVCEAGELSDTVKEVFDTISAMGPGAIREAKSVINSHSHCLLQSGLRNEVQAFQRLFATEDRKEGMTAFMEKRAADFKGC